MEDLVILDIFRDKRTVRDAQGMVFDIYRGKDYDLDWIDLGCGYSKNHRWIYHYDDTCFEKYLKHIDLPSFEIIAHNQNESTIYFKDKNTVYLQSFMCGFALLSAAKPDAFNVIDAENGYSQSGKQDFWYNQPLPYSMHEIVALSMSYQRVGDTIYFGHTQALDCDAATFEVVHPKVTNVAKDKNHVYFKGQKIPGANPVTFRFLDACVDSDAPYYLEQDVHFYAKDDRYAYFINMIHDIKIIKTKDIDGFRLEVIDEIGYGVDTHCRYKMGKKLKPTSAS